MAKAKNVKPILVEDTYKVLFIEDSDDPALMSERLKESFEEAVYEIGFDPETPFELGGVVDENTTMQEYEVKITAEILPRKKYLFTMEPHLEPLD